MLKQDYLTENDRSKQPTEKEAARSKALHKKIDADPTLQTMPSAKAKAKLDKEGI